MLEEKDYLKKQIDVLAKVLRALVDVVLKKGDPIEERLKELADEEILGSNLNLWFNGDEVAYESVLKKQIHNPEMIKYLIFIQIEIARRYLIENNLYKSNFYFTKAMISKNHYDLISTTYDVSLETKYDRLKTILNKK